MTRRRGRARKGQAISEMGPALFILLIVVFFPMLDLLYLGLAYACGWYENHLAVRECACEAPANEAQALGFAQQWWDNSTLHNFIRGQVISQNWNLLDSRTNASVGGAGGVTAANAPYLVVSVQSNIKIQSFLAIPFMQSVPGMGAPITFQYTAERPQEETGLN